MMTFTVSLPYIIMNVKMRAEKYAKLPQWFSSTVRGAVGTELLSAFCKKKITNCAECSRKCTAGILFAGDPHYSSDQAVSPYIISGDSFDGEFLEFRMTLFSTAVTTASDVVSVLRKGLRLGAERTEFKLVSITDAETEDVIFDGLIQTEPAMHYFAADEEEQEKDISSVRVDFITLFRTKVSANQFTFETLVRSALRRASAVFRLSGAEPDFDYSGLIEKAGMVRTESRSFRTHKTHRYSNRSRSEMEVTGFTGYAVYSGDIAEFMPLFRLAEIIHLGKLCVMGLGEIKITVL